MLITFKKNGVRQSGLQKLFEMQLYRSRDHDLGEHIPHTWASSNLGNVHAFPLQCIVLKIELADMFF